MAGTGHVATSRSKEASDAPQLRTMMSFARGMQPTPSEVSLSSTAYSSHPTFGQTRGFEDVPPVPPVPQIYAAPYVEDDTNERTDGEDWPLSASPPAPAPTLQPNRYEYEPEIRTARSTPVNEEVRQENFDKALARLEGRCVDPEPNSEGESISSRRRRKEAKLTPVEREQRKFERFNKRSAKKKAAAVHDRELMIKPAASSLSPDHMSRDAPQRPVVGQGTPNPRGNYVSVPPQGPYIRQPALESTTQLSQPAGSINCFKDVNCAGVPADGRAANPTAYYPYVCHPSKLDGAARLLKSMGKKTRNLLGIQHPPGFAAVYADWMAKLTPEQRAMVAPEIYGEAAMARCSAQAGGMDATDSAPETEPMVSGRDTSSRPGPSRPQTKEGMYKGIPLPPEARKKAPTISLAEAQDKFLGHAELNPVFVAATTPVRAEMVASRPTPPVKVVGDPDRGTVWGDFIAAGEDGDLPATAEEAFSPTSPFATATQLAQEYQAEISPKHYSPVDFSALRESYPTGRRVLYDPELCSWVEMPRFDRDYPRAEDFLVDNVDTLSQSSREDGQRGYLERNRSREDLAGMLRTEKGERGQKRRQRRDRKGRDEAYNDVSFGMA